jgi:hypothetical protein
MTKRRTEITVETERLLVAQSRRTTRVFCARCGLEVETVTTPAAETSEGCAPGDAHRAEGPEEDSH